MPNMKHQLFISQACHINKGSILGLGAKRRNKKKSESRQKNKNLKIDQRGGKKGRRSSSGRTEFDQFRVMGDDYVPILPTDAIYLYSGLISSVSSALLLMQYYTI